MQNPWRRAGALSGTVGLLVVMTLVAALLAAGVTLPFVGIAGIASRDVSNTFNDLSVGQLGQPPARSTLYDSEGQPIAYFYPNDIYRVPVPYNDIAPVMRNAIVAIEDDKFWHEGAMDFRGTVRAFASDVNGGQVQGGSTLAQQYVKNVRVLLGVPGATDETVSRKIQELRIAATIEHDTSQQDLLADYLNVAYFNHSAWGVQMAAEVYFSEPASKLTLTQAALLAGIVQSPTLYDPTANPVDARIRRNQVLVRMAQLHYITSAQATAAEATPIKLKMTTVTNQVGCFSPQSSASAFFCDYVQNVLVRNYPAIWNEIEHGSGGLNIYTTLNMKDQLAADDAVNNVLPRNSRVFNPNHDADTEVLIQPGTGFVRSIAVNRTYGKLSGQDEVDYAVTAPYGGGAGVQTGSSSKIFTLITALEQGVPFGHQIKVVSPSTVSGYQNCEGVPLNPYPVTNSEGPTGKGGQIWQLYSATVDSINVYFAHLEQQVGLCDVVKTAVAMGMTRGDGTSLLKTDKALGKNGEPADDVTSFTLGSVAVAPMSMAAAYASVAADGIYCKPEAITKIVVAATGKELPVQGPQCHRDMPWDVAVAANYILQGVLTQPGATADGRGIGRPAAAKTGTANGGYYAAFAGYTPTLAGYVSVFNPFDPTSGGAMMGTNSCYRQFPGDYLDCPGQMFGDNAPGATWEETFSSRLIQLGPPVGWPGVPSSSIFWSQGPGNGPPTSVNPKKKPHGPHIGPPPPTPTPTTGH